MNLGVVVIGRNEGERLIACLNSVRNPYTVYVDSGSTDESVINAQNVGAICISLDLSTPFTAARARNEGFKALVDAFPHLDYVFFIDGDCEVQREWIQNALGVLDSSPLTAVVCGRRRERYPEASIYNTFCDIEWNTPIGIAKACGGDAIYRVDVLRSVKGFDSTFIAGEEPELCFRIRQLGYQIERIDAEMTLHDANMTRAQQWWKRNERSGHAYLLGWMKHCTASDERYYQSDIRRIMLWATLFYGSVGASLAFLSVVPVFGFSFLLLVQIIRVYGNLQQVKSAYGKSIAFKYACSLMLAKLPQFKGVVKAYFNKKRNIAMTLVEYK